MSRNQLYDFMGNKCQYCRTSVQELYDRFGTVNRMFEFHHIKPKLKSPNYDNLMRNKLNTIKLEELEKCVLLCAQCHKILHAQNQEVTVEFEFRVKDQVVTKKLSGWVITDNLANTKKFITNEAHLLHPYMIKSLGKEFLVFHFQILDNPSILTDEIFKLLPNSSVSISSFITGSNVFTAERDNHDLTLTIHPMLGLFQLEPAQASKREKFWYRNGIYIDDNKVDFNRSIIVKSKFNNLKFEPV